MNKYILDIYIYIYIYIWLIHGIYTTTPGFHGIFCKTTIIRQLRKSNESKINFLFFSLNSKNLYIYI